MIASCDTFNDLQVRTNRNSSFTRERVLKFTSLLVHEMKHRGCLTPYSPGAILPKMKLPPSNESNVSLEIYACKILFACAILELHNDDCAILEGELECARDILDYIHSLYKIASSTEQSRERDFYKRDIVPVYTSYAQHMYATHKSNEREIQQEQALSGAGASVSVSASE